MYKPVIGLEIHTQLKTDSKMFCSCINDPENRNPNEYVCPVCLGHPGTLPVINRKAVLKVLEAGKALNCELRDVSRFDRKSYFYPDLPKGYQISQDRRPLCYSGYLEVEGKRIRINRIHLEEDTGRLVHDNESGHSLVDFNRSGVPLMELVTEADIRSGGEAQKFAEELRLILKHLDISDANMNQGQMRVEVNISLSHMEGRKGTRVEIKNLNSFRAVGRSIEYETERQKKILERGERVLQETRGWDENKGITFSQREKESVDDYRYFPEPDLPPLYLSEPPFNKENLMLSAELPQEKRRRFREEYKIIDKNDLEIFINNKELANYFENIVSESLNCLKEKENKEDVEEKEKEKIINIVKSYLLTDLMGLLEEKMIEKTLITPKNFAEFAFLIYKKEISSKIAKNVLKEMNIKGDSPSHIIEEKGWSQVGGVEEIDLLVKEVLEENKEAVNDYKEGKETAIQFLVGKVMAKTKGRAAPEEVNKSLKKHLQN